MALSKEEKDQTVQHALEQASGILIVAMHLCEIENTIVGKVENDAGEKYELYFKKIKE